MLPLYHLRPGRRAVAKAGGKVIKNVAGYDLAKLFTGSFGTLGLVVEVARQLRQPPSRWICRPGGPGRGHW